ncbi:MAG: NAD(P)/FAD-dependent oxidoreductase, partial [Actinomycetota bacterium]|nr:NAD(P)/FAD-dependent oxidoreductase [Actinomycetota bacterium]
MSTAIVVGGGPNGLAAAARLARAGSDVTVLEASDTVGGGARSSEYLAPGLVHDHCSAAHPMALASPFFQELDLPGLEWCAPEIDCAHPLDDGSAGAFAKSFDVTDDLLGADARRWRQMFAPVAKKFDALFAEISQPVLRVPRHPLTLANFGVRVLPPATLLARTWKTEQARALWGGVAAHAFWRLDRPLTSAVGVTLTAAAHAHGWVVAEGGTQRIVDALVADIVAHGGKIETNTRVSSVNDLPSHDVLMLDVVPSIALEILGDRLPP